MCTARKKATENPFVVYEFYKRNDKITKGQNLTVKHIWNTYLSGFPVNPWKCKVVKKRGETPYKVTLSSKRENILVLPTANADGRVLPLLIIYAGKNCKLLHDDIKIYLALCSVSNLGWISCEAFFSWSEQFCIVVKVRHLLLICRHKTQLST